MPHLVEESHTSHEKPRRRKKRPYHGVLPRIAWRDKPATWFLHRRVKLAFPTKGGAREGWVRVTRTPTMGEATATAFARFSGRLIHRVKGWKGSRLTFLRGEILDVHNPPAWVGDPKVWEKAEREVAPRWHEQEHPWATVTTVYKSMGGRVV